MAGGRTVTGADIVLFLLVIALTWLTIALYRV